ncbi:gluconokinase [uncultured Paraglaciecola sp.]|uniref:gluconokinase n=1 Tax=uncultured Paraglaciecola sp. TaxID=1765024 RepID=UPI0030D7E375|tara:strand:- start:70047 stop:70532 length:486 start_codon:yes stop_codon:yes gene_type:complete
MIYIVMGVSGCGKSTVGKMLSEKLCIPFYDADDYHFPENIKKMANGIPLTDADRKPWLTLLADKIKEWERAGGAVLACSALKQIYRDYLSSTTTDVVKFVYLEGDKALLHSRLTSRESHFMPDTLLDSQLQTLEPPVDAITVSIAHPLDAMLTQILKEVNL